MGNASKGVSLAGERGRRKLVKATRGRGREICNDNGQTTRKKRKKRERYEEKSIDVCNHSSQIRMTAWVASLPSPSL